MNNRMTVTQKLYENHVKESLLAGKPVEYSFKDFMPKDSRKTKSKTKRTKYEKMIYDVFKKGKEMFPDMHKDVISRYSYIKSEIMKLMVECNSIEEVRELYNTYRQIIYYTPVYEY